MLHTGPLTHGSKPYARTVLSDIELKYLADTPEIVPTVASWHHRQWNYLAGARSLSHRIARLHEHLRRTGLPLTVIAWYNGQPIGCASLVDSDMQTRIDFSPWLASVYVLPEYRHRGVGAALVRCIEAEARKQGFTRLYLYTEDRVPFYTYLGWQAIEERVYRGYPMTVMMRDLRQDPPAAPDRQTA